MKTVAIVFAAIAPLALAARKAPQDWKTGKVLDSSVAKSSVVTGAHSTTNGTATAYGSENSAYATGQSNTDTSLNIADIRRNELAISGEDYVYVIEDTRVSGGNGALLHAIANRHHGCRFIVGDTVKYWQEKSTLHVIDADGKECKTDILRQARIGGQK